MTQPSPDASLIPPKEMLIDGSSSPEEFVLLSEGFCQEILIKRAGLVPAASVLDVGCGNGGIARALTGYLTAPGRYQGLDINAGAIAWLREHYQRYSQFEFTHADVYNRMYNPAGAMRASDFVLPVPTSSVHMVLLKSVFTHMLPDELRRYMSEISRVLLPGGRSVISYFLLNDESRRLSERGLDRMGFRHAYADDPGCRVANLDMPEAAVAHDEQRIRDYYAEVGCTMLDITFGDWCGRSSLLGLQDVIFAAKQ